MTILKCPYIVKKWHEIWPFSSREPSTNLTYPCRTYHYFQDNYFWVFVFWKFNLVFPSFGKNSLHLVICHLSFHCNSKNVRRQNTWKTLKVNFGFFVILKLFVACMIVNPKPWIIIIYNNLVQYRLRRC